MNKYQEVLNEMYAVLNDSNRFHKQKDLLQELVDKATPKKPRKYTTNGFDEFECDLCGDYINGSYCHNCGQKIDWSGEEQ